MITDSKILVVGAHPDDIELIAGGSVSRLVREGNQVDGIVVAPSEIDRAHEAIAGMQTLGLTNRLTGWGEFHDRRVEENLAELIDMLHDQHKREQYDVVVTHFHGDTHQDHAATAKACLAAFHKVPTILMAKPQYPSGRTVVPFQGNVILSLDPKDVQRKLRALKKHKSQLKKYGSQEWIDAVKFGLKADAWSIGGFHGYAEVFQLVRTVI